MNLILKNRRLLTIIFVYNLSITVIMCNYIPLFAESMNKLLNYLDETSTFPLFLVKIINPAIIPMQCWERHDVFCVRKNTSQVNVNNSTSPPKNPNVVDGRPTLEHRGPMTRILQFP